MTTTQIYKKASRALVRVGDGRGFVVEGRTDRLVITAAHCLPSFPPCASFSYTEERTYASLLAPLGKDPAVWAECFFIDPIGDIAVLGSPDNQSLFDEADAYEAMVQKAIPLPVAEAPEDGRAWLFSRDGRWFECKTRRIADGPLWISEAENIEGGMSGSPILDSSGAAIGVLSVGSRSADEVCHEGGPQARLARNLPGWMLRQLKMKTEASRRRGQRSASAGTPLTHTRGRTP